MKYFVIGFFLFITSFIIFGISWQLIFFKDQNLSILQENIDNKDKFDKENKVLIEKLKDENLNTEVESKLAKSLNANKIFEQNKIAINKDINSNINKQTNQVKLKKNYKNLSKLMIDIVRIGPDGSAVFAGKGTPKSYLKIIENNVILGETFIDNNGEWVVIVSDPLSTGNHMIIAEMQNENGKKIRSERVIIIEINKNKKTQPLIALAPLNETVLPKIINVPNENSQNKTKLSNINFNNNNIIIETISWKKNNILKITGKKFGNGTITGSLDENQFQEIYFLKNNYWTAEIDLKHFAQKRKDVKLTAQLVSIKGEILDEYYLVFKLFQLDVGKDGSEMVVITKGDMLWRIAYRVLGEGVRYLDIVKKNSNMINNPDLIYPSQVFALP